MVAELVYFNLAARAEPIRMCLHFAKMEWKDTRIAFKDWPQLKPTTPLGTLPVLKLEDGIEHVQSFALARYAGRLAGWYPEDVMEGLVVDEAMETASEMLSKIPKSNDAEESKKLREEYQATTMKKYADFLEASIQRNGGVGFAKKPNIADLRLHGSVEAVGRGTFDHVDPKFFENYPGITATVKMIEANEQFKDYKASTKQP